MTASNHGLALMLENSIGITQGQFYIYIYIYIYIYLFIYLIRKKDVYKKSYFM